VLTREVKPTRATPNHEHPALGFPTGLTYRTAVCGPACTVVWEGRGCVRPPLSRFSNPGDGGDKYLCGDIAEGETFSVCALR
jgi:hypothetical protein